eukprot:g14856.t1
MGQAFVRLTDVNLESDLENECPLAGVDKVATLPIEQAVEQACACLQLDYKKMAVYVSQAKKAARCLKKNAADKLTGDEIAAINLYTHETDLYKQLNAMLQKRQRQELQPAFCYLKLLLTGLHKLPAKVTTVYRGVKLDIASKYAKDKDVVWWGFSSATASLEVLKSPQFLGDHGKRTLFAITTCRAVDIRAYSAIQAEEERLLLPGAQLHVKGVLDLGAGLKMVQLENQPEAPSLLLGFSAAAAAPPTRQEAKSEAKQQAQHHPSKETQVQLGYRYLLGQQGVPRDLAKAVELWTAAAADSAVAQYHLGWAHWYGLGLTENETKGEQLMLQAATRLEELKELTQGTQRNGMAMFCVARIYHFGQFVETNEKLAVEWYEKAAGAGNALAQNSLGVCYHDGQGVQKDFKKAVEWWTEAAEAGDALAQYNLGECYYHGQGVQKDFKKAVEWYTKAAEAGDAKAQFNLGWCYDNGDGVQQDSNKAVEWYKKAAENGNEEAIARLQELGNTCLIL